MSNKENEIIEDKIKMICFRFAVIAILTIVLTIAFIGILIFKN